jgi:hypothetical protein
VHCADGRCVRQLAHVRRRRRRAAGLPHREGASARLHAGEQPGVHGVVPAAGAAAVGAEEDGRGAARRAVLVSGAAPGHVGHVHDAAAAAHALPAPDRRRAAGGAPGRGRAHRGHVAGAVGAAAGAGGGEVHARRERAHVERAARQGQLVPHHGGARLGRGSGAVAGRRAAVAQPVDDRAGPRALPRPGVVPGAGGAHGVAVRVHDRRVVLPVPAPGPCRHGRAAVSGRHGGRRRAGGGVRPGAAARGPPAAVRAAAHAGRAGAARHGRRGGAGRAAAGAGELAGPARQPDLRGRLPRRGRRAVRHAAQDGGRGQRVLLPAPSDVPGPYAPAGGQLLPPPAQPVRQVALRNWGLFNFSLSHTLIILHFAVTITSCATSVSEDRNDKTEIGVCISKYIDSDTFQKEHKDSNNIAVMANLLHLFSIVTSQSQLKCVELKGLISDGSIPQVVLLCSQI